MQIVLEKRPLNWCLSSVVQYIAVTGNQAHILRTIFEFFLNFKPEVKDKTITAIYWTTEDKSPIN